jgi:hypothetical protein
MWCPLHGNQSCNIVTVDAAVDDNDDDSNSKKNNDSIQLNSVLNFKVLAQQIQEPITVSTRKQYVYKKQKSHTYNKHNKTYSINI